MNNLVSLAEKEVLRKDILDLCQQAAPMGCSMDVLAAAFVHSRRQTDRQEMEQQVDYLRAKGLVETNEVGNERLGLRRVIVTITAAGIDYLEGNTDTIPGIGG